MDKEVKTYIFEDVDGTKYWVAQYGGIIGTGETEEEAVKDLEFISSTFVDPYPY